MKSFEILAHTADVRIKAFGHTGEELFQNAVLGLNSILAKEEKKRFIPQNYEKIKIQGPDINVLLVSFLNEILTRSQINKKIYKKVKFLKFGEKELEAQIFGETVQNFDEDVKAVTYHDTKIQKNKRNIFETTLTLDI